MKHHFGLLFATIVVLCSIVICGFVGSDALNFEANGGGQTSGTMEGIVQIQQTIGETSSQFQDVLALISIAMVILVAFFLFAPNNKKSA